MLKITGSIKRDMDKLAKNIKSVNKQHEIKYIDLITTNFLILHTHGKFNSAKDFFEAGGFKSINDFSPNENWEEFIRSVSSFGSWQDMVDEALKGWANKTIGKAVIKAISK